MHERRVAKQRPTLNERRSGTSEQALRPGEASSTRAAERPAPPRVSEDLIRLACLWQAGALSDSEFEAAKAKLLAAYWKTQSPA